MNDSVAIFTALAGIGGIVLILALLAWGVFSLLLIVPTWRICTRAGLSGAIALFHLVPFVGSLVVLCVLGFSTWPAGEADRPGGRRRP